jgi:hypothetical protein
MPLQKLQQLFLPRLAERKPVKRQGLLQIVESCRLAGQRQHRQAPLDLGGAVENPKRHHVVWGGASVHRRVKDRCPLIAPAFGAFAS